MNDLVSTKDSGCGGDRDYHVDYGFEGKNYVWNYVWNWGRMTCDSLSSWIKVELKISCFRSSYHIRQKCHLEK